MNNDHAAGKGTMTIKSIEDSATDRRIIDASVCAA